MAELTYGQTAYIARSAARLHLRRWPDREPSAASFIGAKRSEIMDVEAIRVEPSRTQAGHALKMRLGGRMLTLELVAGVRSAGKTSRPLRGDYD